MLNSQILALMFSEHPTIKTKSETSPALSSPTESIIELANKPDLSIAASMSPVSLKPDEKEAISRLEVTISVSASGSTYTNVDR